MEKILDVFNTFDFRQYFKKSREPVYIKDVELNYINKGAQGYVYSIQYENIKLALKIQLNMKKEEKHLTDYIIKLKEKPHIVNIITMRIIKNFTFVLMDFYDGDLNDWAKTYHKDEIWIDMIKQILLGIQFMQDELQTCHTDLKPRNVLYKKVNDKYVFIITDFGRSESLKFTQSRLTPKEIHECITNNSDFYNISTFIKRIQIRWLLKQYNKKQLIEIIKKNNDVRFDSYYKQEKDKIWNTPGITSDTVKEMLLVKNIAYYIIERDYNVELSDKIKIQKLPSKKIIKFMEKIFSMKTPIKDILQINF